MERMIEEPIRKDGGDFLVGGDERVPARTTTKAGVSLVWEASENDDGEAMLTAAFAVGCAEYVAVVALDPDAATPCLQSADCYELLAFTGEPTVGLAATTPWTRGRRAISRPCR